MWTVLSSTHTKAHLKTTKSRAQRCGTGHAQENKSRARKTKKCAWAEKNRAHGPVKARAQEIKNRAHGKQKKCALPVKSARMAQQKRAPHHKKVRARRPKSHAHAGKKKGHFLFLLQVRYPLPLFFVKQGPGVDLCGLFSCTTKGRRFIGFNRPFWLWYIIIGIAVRCVMYSFFL